MRYFIFLIGLSLFFSCKKDQAVPVPIPPQQRGVDILFFVKEKSIEVWEQDTLLEKKDNSLVNEQLPIGFFNVERYDSLGLALQFPDAFRQRKAIVDKSIFQEKLNETIRWNEAIRWKKLGWKIEKAVIFPSRMKSERGFEASYPSPHWLSELYAQLENYLSPKHNRLNDD